MIVGDKVKVINDYMCYAHYKSFARKHLNKKQYSKWLALCKTLSVADCTDGDEGTIIAIGTHMFQDITLVIVDAPNLIFIIDERGVQII